MKDPMKKTGPSSENIFWFDAGRSYQLGVSCSVMKKKKFSLDQFRFYGHPILIRYLKDNATILELYQAYDEGFDKGANAMKELLGKIVSEPKGIS